MRKLFLAGAGALALACGATMASAQVEAPAATSMTAEQQTAYDAWPPERKSAYDAWPVEYKAYFWSLNDSQKTGWWALTDAQRKQVYDLPPAQRAQAWTSIEAQIAGAGATTGSATPATGTPAPMTGAMATSDPMAESAAGPMEQVQANPVGAGTPTATPPNPETAASAVPPAMPADPGYNAGPYKGAMTEPPAAAMNKTYPVCTRKIQDACRNPGGK